MGVQSGACGKVRYEARDVKFDGLECKSVISIWKDRSPKKRISRGKFGKKVALKVLISKIWKHIFTVRALQKHCHQPLLGSLLVHRNNMDYKLPLVHKIFKNSIIGPPTKKIAQPWRKVLYQNK